MVSVAVPEVVQKQETWVRDNKTPTTTTLPTYQNGVDSEGRNVDVPEPQLNGVQPNGVKTNGTHANGHTTKDESFIREAVSKCGVNALRMALYQITADPDLATMKVSKQKIRGGVLFDYLLSPEDEEIVKEKAVQFLLEGEHAIPPPPSIQECHKMMNLFAGQKIKQNDILPGYEELAFDEYPRGVEWSTKPPAERIANFKVLIIGAGLSGIATAVNLKRLGIPFTVIERQSELGGTWLLNSYPECRVDTLSFLFQYKFEKNYKWKDYFASRQETVTYLNHIAKKYGVENYFSYNREVFHAQWDESSYTWRVKIKNKKSGAVEEMEVKAIISASGLFATPKIPDIPGLPKYKGAMFHTTQWDHSFDWTGKRVALIGTGSTGTQLMPALAKTASHLTVYQRTANWIASYEGYGQSVDDYMSYMTDAFPYYWNWYCYASYYRSLDLAAIQVIDHEYEAKGGLVNERNAAVKEALLKIIHTRMADKPELIPKLIPTHAPLVRRLVVDNGFYDSLKKDHVDLVTEGIDHMDETGIVTKDGEKRDFDLIVLAGGFVTSKYFFPCEYIGRGGTTLEDSWKKDGARSYLGMSMPGFPNLFTLYGPNHQPRGGGLYSWAEIWSRYAVTSVVWMIENDVKSMEVNRKVYDDYQVILDEGIRKLIWESDGAGYYVNEFGRQGVNMPWTCADYDEMVRKPNIADYDIS
ncbi:hypothetical protein MMC08_008271 [Hypocenomyce scalaris]|nr:hypothetical protein [Hypocenomyce scalaris]